MKKIFKIMGCAMLVASLTGCGNNPKPSNEEESVVALTKGEYNLTVGDLYKTLKERYATNYIINEIDKVILSKEYETDDKAKEYAENQLKITKLYYGNDDNQLLTALKNAGYDSFDQYKEYLIVNYKRNLATDDYAKSMITDKEIDKYYNENVYGDVTIRHILIKLESSENLTTDEQKEAEEKAQEKIKTIYEKLNDGTSFDEVAKEYSEDTATAGKGGLLGTFNKSEMSKQFNDEFENAVIALKTGKYTEKVVKSSYGYHIIYKENEKDKPAIETIKQTILDNLLEDKKDEDNKIQYKALIALREKYGLSFNDKDVQSQYETAKNNWLYGDE